jgi:type I restriction enzyme M protein
MVRLSQVNMYLHGFPNPHIYEYDTLTSEEKWEERFDVMMANPPFMTPKGGIRPHKRFSVQANRCEVLFVDYIMEHLNNKGRAGIIVPEGIIFQSGKAYKELRKNLVNDGLFAVVSLPAGVFNPYSGVKTSILFFDNEIAKKTKDFLFVKVKSDGYDLGAQRRKIEKNDLEDASVILKSFRASVRNEENQETIKSFISGSDKGFLVSKEKIAEADDYNLSADRYRIVTNTKDAKYELIELGEVCEIFNGSTPKRTESSYWENGTIPWFTIDDIRKQGRIIKNTQQFITEKGFNESSVKILPKNTTLICCTASIGEYAYTEIELTTNQQFNGLVIKEEYRQKLDSKFLFWCATKFKDELIRMSGKSTFGFVSVSTLKKFKIPLPPIEIQKEIVEQIEVKQKAIEGAEQVIENLERERRYFGQELRKLEGVEMVELGKIAEVGAGQSPEGKYYNEIKDGTPFYQGKTEFGDTFLGEPKVWTTKVTKLAMEGDIIMSVRAPVGPVNITKEKICIGRGLASIRAKNVEQLYLFHFLRSVQNEITGNGGAVFDSINKSQIEKIIVPMVSTELQKEIVEKVNIEEIILESNKKLIDIMEKKINEVLETL